MRSAYDKCKRLNKPKSKVIKINDETYIFYIKPNTLNQPKLLKEDGNGMLKVVATHST